MSETSAMPEIGGRRPIPIAVEADKSIRRSNDSMRETMSPPRVAMLGPLSPRPRLWGDFTQRRANRGEQICCRGRLSWMPAQVRFR